MVANYNLQHCFDNSFKNLMSLFFLTDAKFYFNYEEVFLYFYHIRKLIFQFEIKNTWCKIFQNKSAQTKKNEKGEFIKEKHL